VLTADFPSPSPASFFGSSVLVVAVSVFGGVGFGRAGGVRRRGLRAVEDLGGRVLADLGGAVFASLSSVDFSVAVSAFGVGSGVAEGVSEGGSAIVAPTEFTRLVPGLLPATSVFSAPLSATGIPPLKGA
jgi:hypothetical protein